MTNRALFILAVLGAVSVGCSGPSRVAAPRWSPATSAGKAMELWDSNGNGSLDGDELSQCPGLTRDLPAIDADGDGAISMEELQARLAEFEENATGLKAASFLVTLNGRPLRDAQVRFIPEAFLDEVLEPATGKTNNSGVVKPRSASADLRAMQLGYYRVEIDSPQIQTDAGRESVAGLGVSVDPFSYGRQTIAIED